MEKANPEIVWVDAFAVGRPIGDATAKFGERIAARKSAKGTVVTWPVSSIVTWKMKSDPTAANQKLYVFWQDAGQVRKGALVAAVAEDGVCFVVKAATILRLQIRPLIFCSTSQRSIKALDEPLLEYFEQLIPGPHASSIKHHQQTVLRQSIRQTAVSGTDYWLMFNGASYFQDGEGWSHNLLGRSGDSPCKAKRGKLYNWGDHTRTWQPIIARSGLVAEMHGLGAEGVTVTAHSRLGAAVMGMPESSVQPVEGPMRPAREKLGEEVAANILNGSYFQGFLAGFAGENVLNIERLTEHQRIQLCGASGIELHLAGRTGRFETGVTCLFCGAERTPTSKLFECSRCFGATAFCSKEHQAAAWPAHKDTCKKHQKLVRAAIEKICASPHYPFCRTLSSHFQLPRAEPPMKISRALSSRVPADWIDGLTMAEATAVLTSSPNLVIAKLAREGGGESPLEQQEVQEAKPRGSVR